MYRMFCNLLFVICAQWAGNGPLSYFLPAVLTTIGITNSITQANVNLGYACFQFVFALTGAAFVERIGRRPLMLFSMTGCAIIWIFIAATGGVVANSDNTNTAAGRAGLAFIFLFGAVYSVGLTPLQALYPVEVLSYEMRAKGMALSSIGVAIAGLFNQYANPVAIKHIGWKFYIVFIVWDTVNALLFYFFLPETKGRTVSITVIPLVLMWSKTNTVLQLEELDQVFDAKNPVKASLERKKVLFAEEGNVVGVEKI